MWVVLILFVFWLIVTISQNKKEKIREQVKQDIEIYDMVLSDMEPLLSKLLYYAPKEFWDYVTNNIKNFVFKDEIMRNQFLKIHLLMASNPNTDAKKQHVVMMLIILYNGFIQKHLDMRNNFREFLLNLCKEEKHTTSFIASLLPKEYLPDNFKI